MDPTVTSSSSPPSPTHALVVLPHHDVEALVESQSWQPILSLSNQVVLYNPTSHALTVRSTPPVPARSTELCPYCHRPYHFTNPVLSDKSEPTSSFNSPGHSGPSSRARDYFHLLEIANETSSRPATPGGHSSSGSPFSSRIHSTRSMLHSRMSNFESGGGSTFSAETMAQGYFNAFFREEYRLGMGANGSVYLCQHVLDGNPLGHFAVKKIAVGQSHSYLYKTLREVHLLESLRHPNIITYHHAWLENFQFSNFGPRVPTLFVLMQWAEGGSLDDFIELRLGRPLSKPHPFQSHTSNTLSTPDNSNFDVVNENMDSNAISRAERIRAFRAAQARRHSQGFQENDVITHDRQHSKEKEGITIQTAVHLLSAEEAKSLFGDVVSGLTFLHNRSILHLDLKPGNVLLTWDEGTLIPRAMLSDFGTSQDRIQPDRRRSGWTGTLEYTPPELLPSPLTGALKEVDSKADMWSLGMILHMMLFFRLPWRHSRGADALRMSGNGSKDKNGRGKEEEELGLLEKEVLDYKGFKFSSTIRDAFELRGLSIAYLMLLESLLNTVPKMRPSSERVLKIIREGKLDPVAPRVSGEGTLISVPYPRVPSPAIVVDHDGTFPSYMQDENEKQSSNADGTSSPAEVDGILDYEGSSEKTPHLALPPSPIYVPPKMISGSIIPVLPFAGLDFSAGSIRFRLSYQSIIRGFKTVLLLVKITTLQSLCPFTSIIDSSLSLEIQPITTALIFVAIMDLWTDRLSNSLYLLAFHLVGVMILKYNGWCTPL